MYRQTFNSNNADEISLKEKKNKQLGLSDMNGRCVLIHMKGDLPLSNSVKIQFLKTCYGGLYIYCTRLQGIG